MPQTVELPDELAEALTDEASRMGLSLPDYTLRLLAARTAPTAIRNGAELVAFWQAEGLIGSRPEIADSQAHARGLREQAQRRASGA